MHISSISILAVLLSISPAQAADPEIPEQPDSAATTVAPAEIIVSAVGDIMLDASSRTVLQEQGYDYPYAQVRNYFSNSQIVFGNLEGPLTDRGTPEQDKKFVFRSPPDKVSAALKNAGFNVVTLANNHTLDYSADGLAQTIETLDAAGIQHVGAGADLMAARRPATFQINGQRIAVLGYSMTLPENFYAGEHNAGTAFGHEDQVRDDVRAARTQADIVLVAFHWGQEGKTELRDYQTRLGHLAIDSGASAVVGHHPHILQGIERYKDGVIIYSLGNFTFGSYSSHSTRSAIAQLHFRNGRLQQVQMIPINVNNFEVQFQPQPLHGEAADEVIANLHTLSAALNTEVHNDGGVGIITLDEANSPH
jgi:poly-gamma-glutamate capsule biosynthesis protein CapA/YwtB (metallophosphatase superfamily)